MNFKLDENQIYVDWDFNTYELAIFIKPKRVLMQDVAEPNHVSDKEMLARGEFEILRKEILRLLNNKKSKKTK